MTDGLPVIVLGAGGHGKVCVGGLKAGGVIVLGLTDPIAALHGTEVLGVPVLGGDDAVLRYGSDDIMLVNGIGSVDSTGARRAVYERFSDAGYGFRVVVHPSAVIGEGTTIGDGAQIMAGAVIQPDCWIGANTIVNTGAVVDHDSIVGNHAHVAPGAVLGGAVRVGKGVHVGAGAVVIQGIEIGSEALVAAGASVIADIPAGGRVAGTPARNM